MSKVLRRSAKGFGCLFVLNWDMLLFFSATGIAIAGWHYLITM